MKFTEHLGAHLTPEWRSQYIRYEVRKHDEIISTACVQYRTFAFSGFYHSSLISHAYYFHRLNFFYIRLGEKIRLKLTIHGFRLLKITCTGKNLNKSRCSCLPKFLLLLWILIRFVPLISSVHTQFQNPGKSSPQNVNE